MLFVEKWTLLMCTGILLCFVHGDEVEERPIIRVQSGQIRGIKMKGRGNGADFFAFMGIPYAAPPVGDLRYKAPRSAIPWNGIRDATTEGDMCPQADTPLFVSGSEDCLFINVYTPTLTCPSGSDKLPVMLYIHGGMFVSHTPRLAEYGPEFLAKHNVIVATINYRLGVLGFANLNTRDVPGNAGLKDQVEALRWLQKNVAAFCGDPEKVTIFGESAGGKSVGYLGLIEQSRGLFRAAIQMSGQPLGNMAFTDDNVNRAKRLVSAMLNKKDIDTSTAEKTLREARMEDIVRVSKVMFLRGAGWGMPFNFFTPSLEARPPDDEPVALSRDPDSLLRNPPFQRVPTLTGVNSREGWFFTRVITPVQMMELRANFDTYLSEEILRLGISTSQELGVSQYPDRQTTAKIAQRVREKYFNGNEVSLLYQTSLADLVGDLQYVVPLRRMVSLDNQTSPMYLYLFDVRSDYNEHLDMTVRGISGSTHTDDLAYIFRKASLNQNMEGTGTAPRTLRVFTRLFADFAKFLTSDLLPPDATKHRENPPYLYIGKEIGTRTTNTLGMGDRLEFWEYILDKLRTKTPAAA